MPLQCLFQTMCCRHLPDPIRQLHTDDCWLKCSDLDIFGEFFLMYCGCKPQHSITHLYIIVKESRVHRGKIYFLQISSALLILHSFEKAVAESINCNLPWKINLQPMWLSVTYIHNNKALTGCIGKPELSHEICPCSVFLRLCVADTYLTSPASCILMTAD